MSPTHHSTNLSKSKQLQNSEERCRHLFEEMIAGFGLHEIIFDENGKPIDYITLAINPAFTRMTGLKEADLLNRRILEVLPDLDPVWIEKLGRVAKTGEPHRYLDYVTPLAQWYEGIAYRPEPGQCAVTIFNVTDRVKAEMAQARLTKALQTISDCNQALVRVHSEQALLEAFTRIPVDVGRYASAWIGLKGDENDFLRTACAFGANDHFLRQLEVTAPDATSQASPALLAFEKCEMIILNDIHQAESFGGWRDTALNCGIQSAIFFPLKDSSQCFGCIAIFANEKEAFVTEEVKVLRELAGDLEFGILNLRAEAAHRVTQEALNKAEERVKQLGKLEAIGQLAGGVAHDFNNLLTAIEGYAELIAKRLPEDSPIRSEVEGICDVVERGSALTQQLLAFARHQPLEPRIIRVNEAVQKLGPMLRRLIKESIALEYHLDPEVPCAMIDQNQIDQIVINLVVNARDAIQNSGRISLRTSIGIFGGEQAGSLRSLDPGEYCVIQIEDTGCGMSEEVRRHCLEPFFTTKQVGKGTGLGLSTVYGLVRQANGYLAILSQLNVGTQVTIYLPACQKTKPQELTAASKQIRLSNETLTGTILVVDDDDAVRSVVVKVLESVGYTVLAAIDGNHALQVSKDFQGHIDLMVTDSVMPHFGGKELAFHVRKTRPEIKVLVMSGYSEEECLVNDLTQNSIPFIAKPFRIVELTNKVKSILES